MNLVGFDVGRPTRTVTVFVSSGDDAQVLRDRVSALGQLFNEQLNQVSSSIQIHIDRWEHTAAQRAPGGQVNALFVERAKNSDLTLVLLIGRIGPGTRAEIDAVKNEQKPMLSILWFKPENEEDVDQELRQFVEAMKEENFLNVLGPWKGDDGWLGLIRIVLALVLAAANRVQT
jgi:hypothetical protein